MKRANYHCQSCTNVVPHRHMHDCAHGIAETHMEGSERFECTLCGHRTYAHQPGAARFSFVFDVPPQRNVAVTPQQQDIEQ